MLSVFCNGVTVDQDVGDKPGAKDVEEVKEDIVDEVLEGCWGIAESEKHDFVLVVA